MVGLIWQCPYYKDESHVLGGSPFDCIALLPVRGFCASVVILGLYALLDEDIADQAVDDVGTDGDVGARPEHDA